ncbi:MAG: exopolysaccharide biosynthesis protein [Rhodospirillales bacterium]|nr:exopolysaccharide biosynthesis protein [Rhodospirillales bacterium]MCB9973837.1 exopolysaccharide biosynthesis protein [Rhodospirillales bacterium]
MDTPRSLSQLLTDFSADLKENYSGATTISLSEIIAAFHERGFGVILFIFALPMALPLPVPPGINVLLATPLILLTAQQLIGRRDIWLPQKMRHKGLPAKGLIKMLDKSVPWIAKIEVLIRPRLGFLTQGLFSHLIGLCGLIMALTVCIPLPLTNTVPSMGIACMAIGVVMRDGLAVLSGIIIGLCWIALLLILGETGLRLLFETILS